MTVRGTRSSGNFAEGLAALATATRLAYFEQSDRPRHRGESAAAERRLMSCCWVAQTEGSSLLTSQEITELCEQFGLEAHVTGLLAALRPAYRVEPEAAGAHRVGGEPDLLVGEAWPVNDRGAQLTFIAQIDTTQLPPLPDSGEPIEAWRTRPALLGCSSTATTGRTSTTKLSCSLATQPRRGNERDRPFGRRCRHLTMRITPSPDSARCPFMQCLAGRSSQRIRCCERLKTSSRSTSGFTIRCATSRVASAMAGQRPTTRASSSRVSYSARLSRCRTILVTTGRAETTHRSRHSQIFTRGRLVLQLDDSFASYGDGGAFFAVIPTVDLAAGRYDRMVCATDSG